jgi:hypothetical protein
MRSYLSIYSLFLLLSAVISDVGLHSDIFNEGYVDENPDLYSFLEKEPIIDNNNNSNPIVDLDISGNNMDEELTGDVLPSFASHGYCSPTSSTSLSSSSIFEDSLLKSLTRKLRIRQQDRCNGVTEQQQAPSSPPIKLELPQLTLPPETELEPQNPLLRKFPIEPPFTKEPDCEDDKQSYCCPYPPEPDGTRGGCVECEKATLFASLF